MDWMELTWVLITLIGTTACVSNLNDADKDARSVDGDPELQIIARRAVRVESLRLVTFLTFLSAGVLALLTGASNSPREVIILLLIVGVLAMTANSALDNQYRRGILRQVAASRRKRCRCGGNPP
jgi:hypothetical protein